MSSKLLLVFQVAEGPCSSNNSGQEVDHRKPIEGLAAAFQHLKERSKPFEGQDDVEEQVKNYLNSPLETVCCLKYWERQESQNKNKTIQALCRVAHKFLTPPPTSTDVERLFSIASLIADDKRSSLLPANLEKMLFLRENVMVFNFDLAWD